MPPGADLKFAAPLKTPQRLYSRPRTKVSGVAGGRADQGGTFRGAAKIDLNFKIWGGGKYFKAGKNFLWGGGRLLRGWRVTVDSRQILLTETCKKSQREGVANLRSAPGGRHPSYATDQGF